MLRARSAAAAGRGSPASNCCPGIQVLSLPRTRASSTRYGATAIGGDYPRCGTKKVYLEPSEPFGWLNDPPGVNRLIGLYWLATLFYDFPGYEDLRGIACEFYDKFYRLRLTNAQLNNMLAPAGIPRPEPLRPVGQPLTPGPRTAPVPAGIGAPLLRLGASRNRYRYRAHPERRTLAGSPGPGRCAMHDPRRCGPNYRAGGTGSGRIWPARGPRCTRRARGPASSAGRRKGNRCAVLPRIAAQSGAIDRARPGRTGSSDP